MDNILKRNKDGSIIWTEKQISYIIFNYNQNHSTGELAQHFNTSRQAIRNCLKRNGVKTLTLKEVQHLKHPRRSDYFSKINTKEKAYWLGFLYADGCVSESRNTISICVKRSDEYILCNFLKELGGSNVISHSQKRTGDKIFYMSHVAIRDSQLKKDLIKWGCTPNKSYSDNHLPDLPTDLMWHFVRGCVDGGGSINHSNKNLRLSFTSCSEVFLEELKGFLKKDKLALDKHKTPMLVIAGGKQLKPIFDNIYKDSNETIRLKRKYNIYRDHYGLCA